MSDRPPEWRERPDYRDWPDYEGETDSGHGTNGRNHAGRGRRRALPDWRDGAARDGYEDDPTGQPGQQWPAPGTRPAPGWQDAGDRSGQGRHGAPPDWRGGAGDEQGNEPGWRGAGQAAQEPGWHGAGGASPAPGEPGTAPSGTQDSGRVVADRAQRNSGRITGRLTRRTDRGSLFRSRRAPGAPTPPQEPQAPGAAPQAAQPHGEPRWSPGAREAPAGEPQRPIPPHAWASGDEDRPSRYADQPAPPLESRYGRAPGGSGFGGATPTQPGWPAGQPGGEPRWSPEAREASGGEPPRPIPPNAWAHGGEPRFAAPAPEVRPHPGYGRAPAYREEPGYGDGPYEEAPGFGEVQAAGGAGFGYGGPHAPAAPEELAAQAAGQEWDEEDEEPAEADEDEAHGRWGPQAPAASARGRQRRGAHRRARTRALPRVPKARRARVPQASLALAAIAILFAGGLAGLMNLVPKVRGPAVADAGAPYSARWVCPLLPNSVGTVTANNVGQTPASLEAASNAQPGGAGQPAQLAARATRTFHAQGGTNGGFVQVEAFGAPVAATSAGQPPCVAGPATRWWLPGLTSSSDSRVTLVIANPEKVDATVNITPHLTEGSLHPEALQNVFVRAGTTLLKNINVPEVQNLDYTAEVVASQGRVAVGARLDSKIGNEQQHLIVPAQPALRSSWAFTGGLGGEVRQVELLVTNPNPEPLSLVVEGVNDQGPFKVAGFDLPIADGASNEAPVPVNLGKAAVFGLRVRSQDGSRFVAALRYGSGSGPINTSHLDLGGSGLDARWMAPVVPQSRRLVLANTAQEPITATLSVLGGGAAPASAAAAPQAAKGGSVTIEPGQVRFTDVPKGVQSLLLLADAPGLVAAPVGPGQLIPGSEVGGVPLEGAVTPGPAAAP